MDMNTKQERHPIRVGDAINTCLELAEKNQGAGLGIPSGFPCMDRLTHGWKAGELVVLGGRPCCGRTAMALCMAHDAAVAFCVPTAYISHDLTVMELRSFRDAASHVMERN